MEYASEKVLWSLLHLPSGIEGTVRPSRCWNDFKHSSFFKGRAISPFSKLVMVIKGLCSLAQTKVSNTIWDAPENQSTHEVLFLCRAISKHQHLLIYPHGTYFWISNIHELILREFPFCWRGHEGKKCSRNPCSPGFHLFQRITVNACTRGKVPAPSSSAQGREAKPHKDPNPLYQCAPNSLEKQEQRPGWVLLDNQDHGHLEKVQMLCRKRRAWKKSGIGWVSHLPVQSLSFRGVWRDLTLILRS